MIHPTEAKQLSRAASTLLFMGLDFATKPNGQYPSEDFEKILARSAFDGESMRLLRLLELPRSSAVDPLIPHFYYNENGEETRGMRELLTSR